VSLERLRFDALGADCELLVEGGPAARLADAAAWVGAQHIRLTRFDPRSELSHLNAHAGGWVNVSPILEELLRESLRAWTVSGGLVHVGVLAAVLATGYTRPLREGPTTAVLDAPPPPALPAMLEVRAGAARLAPGTGVDLGGIAKGWMADRLTEQMGPNSVANLGGDLFARGHGPDGAGWPIGFAGRTLFLSDRGVATSGVRGRSWGDGLHHLVDPRTGLPADSDVAEVSVVALSAAEAEVLAKTALLLGQEEGEAFLFGRSDAYRVLPV